MDDKEEIISGDDSAYMTDAYFQAKTEGLIGNDVTIEQFREMTEHKITEDPSDDLFEEQLSSMEQVAKLFKNETTRKEVLEKWFGGKS